MIDKKHWDDCISKSFNGNVYAWSWYLDIVHPKWEALVENDYERVMALPSLRNEYDLPASCFIIDEVRNGEDVYREDVYTPMLHGEE